MKKLLLPLLMLFLSACGTASYTLKPVEEPTLWSQGVGYNELAQNNVNVAVDSGIFDLVTGNDQIRAENPEVLITSLDQQISSRRTLNDPLGLGLIGTVVDLTDRTQEAKERERQRNENTARMEADVREMQLEKDKVAIRFLRRTTLRPGQSVNGIVQFSVTSSQREPGKVLALRGAAGTVEFQVERK